MIIYKARNKITEEVYIGQTKKKLCERRRDHVYEAFKRGLNDKFHSALREFGLRQFEWTELARAKSYTKLSKLEFCFIEMHDSIRYGYNTLYRNDSSAVHRINKQNYKNGFKSS